MGAFLQSLRAESPAHTVEEAEQGFAIVRRADAATTAFNSLARNAIDHSGDDYVALPRTDGPASYDRVFIIPI